MESIILNKGLQKLQKQPTRVVLRKKCSENCIKFTGEHPCRSAISIKLLCNFRHGCSPVNLLHIFRTSFPKNTSGRLLLKLLIRQKCIHRYHRKCCPGVFIVNYQQISDIVFIDRLNTVLPGYKFCIINLFDLFVFSCC